MRAITGILPGVTSDTRRPNVDLNPDDEVRFKREIQTLLKHTSPSVIGARLRRYRIRQGQSIRDLAKRAHVSTNSVLRIEKGGRVHALTILKICDALGLHVVRLGDVDNLEPDGISAVHKHLDDRWFDLTNLGTGPLEGQDRPLSPEERDAMVRRGTVGVPLLILRSRLEAGRILPTVMELYRESEPRSHIGEEFIYVLRGSAKITVGSRTHVLDQGEGITFWSAEEHSYAPAEDSPLPVSVLCVRIDYKGGPEIG